MKNMRDLINLFESSTFDRWATDSMRAVYDSIMHRIKMQYMDLVQKHGPEKVLQAVESAAEFYGDRELDEIGSSDVHAYLSSVFSDLGEDLDAWRDRADEGETNTGSSILKDVKVKSDKKVAAYKEKGFRIGDAPQVNAFAPNDDYPAPWRAVGRPMEPWSIYSDNNKTVATWLTQEEAKGAVAEVQGNTEESVIREDSDISMLADELEEIAQTIMELTDQAMGLLPSGQVRNRAEAYWYGHIMSAAGDDSYAGQSMATMMDTVTELREMGDDGDEY